MNRNPRFSLSPRSLVLNGTFAAAACAIALTLTAGPALAETTGLARVEVAGKTSTDAPRHDVRATCAGIDEQLQQSLQGVWQAQGKAGEMEVSFVLKGSDITGVSTHGMSRSHRAAVQHVVLGLHCSDTQANQQAQRFSFQVAFSDPRSGTFASTGGIQTLALLRE